MSGGSFKLATLNEANQKQAKSLSYKTTSCTTANSSSSTTSTSKLKNVGDFIWSRLTRPRTALINANTNNSEMTTCSLDAHTAKTTTNATKAEKKQKRKKMLFSFFDSSFSTKTKSSKKISRYDLANQEEKIYDNNLVDMKLKSIDDATLEKNINSMKPNFIDNSMCKSKISAASRQVRRPATKVAQMRNSRINDAEPKPIIQETIADQVNTVSFNNEISLANEPIEIEDVVVSTKDLTKNPLSSQEQISTSTLSSPSSASNDSLNQMNSLSKHGDIFHKKSIIKSTDSIADNRISSNSSISNKSTPKDKANEQIEETYVTVLPMISTESVNKKASLFGSASALKSNIYDNNVNNRKNIYILKENDLKSKSYERLDESDCNNTSTANSTSAKFKKTSSKILNFIQSNISTSKQRLSSSKKNQLNISNSSGDLLSSMKKSEGDEQLSKSHTKLVYSKSLKQSQTSNNEISTSNKVELNDIDEVRGEIVAVDDNGDKNDAIEIEAINIGSNKLSEEINIALDNLKGAKSKSFIHPTDKMLEEPCWKELAFKKHHAWNQKNSIGNEATTDDPNDFIEVSKTVAPTIQPSLNNTLVNIRNEGKVKLLIKEMEK